MEDLVTVGTALWGTRWQSDMARVLGVDSRRVREWTAGERSIPPHVWPLLAAELKARAGLCTGLARTIRRHSKAKPE